MRWKQQSQHFSNRVNYKEKINELELRNVKNAITLLLKTNPIFSLIPYEKIPDDTKIPFNEKILEWLSEDEQKTWKGIKKEDRTNHLIKVINLVRQQEGRADRTLKKM